MHYLRIEIYQPQSHYRIPTTYQRRHTYPIPPYSTLIGFLCNTLGINDQRLKRKIDEEEICLYDELKKIKISIAGCFESKVTEYIWFRNLSKEKHEKRFGYAENRYIGGHIEHIGGQSPILIDTLNNVELVIHLAHEKESFLRHIKSCVEDSTYRLEPLHIGRSEDWILIREVKIIPELEARREDGNYGFFFWIPKKIFRPEDKGEITKFECFEGVSYKITTFWKVEGFKDTLNRHGRRIFEYMMVKLSDGLMVNHRFLYDKEKNLPVFLADFSEDQEDQSKDQKEISN